MICAISRLPMAHQWRRRTCADDKMRLVKKLALLRAPLLLIQRRIDGALAQKTHHEQAHGQLPCRPSFRITRARTQTLVGLLAAGRQGASRHG